MEKIEIFVLENDFLKVELLNLGAVIKKIELVNADNGYIESAVITYGNGDTTEYILSVASFNDALTQDERVYFEK